MKFLVPIFALLIFSSCSTVINGTTQKITVTSNVQGAEVTMNGTVIGRTPITTRVKRENTVHLIVRKDGYKDYQQQLVTKLDPWFWGNILIGGLLGSTTDTVSGSTHLIDPETIFVQMEPDTASKALQSDSKDVEIRNFVTQSYSNLVKDIKNGRGDYLRSLFSLMEIKKEKQENSLSQFKSMTNLYSTVHELAEEMVKFYQKNK